MKAKGGLFKEPKVWGQPRRQKSGKSETAGSQEGEGAEKAGCRARKFKRKAEHSVKKKRI